MQAIAVLSARNTDNRTVDVLSDFVQRAGLADIDVLSVPGSSSHAVQAPCPAEWPLEQIRADAEPLQIDVNLVTQSRRRKELLLADMDATIIRGESLDELAQLAGIADQIKPITAQAMAGELDFKEALSARLALLAGQPENLLEHIVQNTQITQGARQLVATMCANNARCYLVSGGFTFLTGEITKRLGFTDHHSNIMEVADGKLTGRAIPPILGKQAKLDYLKQYIKMFTLTPDQTICVGDGANDMAMLRYAGMGVAFEGKPALREQIKLQLNHTDLTGLLYLQGYRASEFKGD